MLDGTGERFDSSNTYKYLDIYCGDFYNPKRILTFGRPWNFITGPRSVGKSTGVSLFIILDYILNGKKMFYVRRNRDEIRRTRNSFFNNCVKIINKFSEDTGIKIIELVLRNSTYTIKYIINGEEKEGELGKTLELSNEESYKSGGFSEYYNLLYDEFISKDKTRYLGTLSTPEKEYEACVSIYETVDRDMDNLARNEVRFWFLGNTASVYNPIYLSLDIIDFWDENAHFIRPKNALWVLEQLKDKDIPATKKRQQSFAYRLSTKAHKQYAYENRGFEEEDKRFVQGLPKIRYYVCTLVLEKKEYGVYKSPEGCYYINKVMNIGMPRYSLDPQSFGEDNLRLITRLSDIYTLNEMHEKLLCGQLFFGSEKIKRSFYKYLKMLP